MAFLVLLTIVITVLSGFYPALVLSGFNPISVFKNKITVKTIGGVSLRRGLVVFQFVIAQVMIIAMIVVMSQINYFKNASLGFNKDSVLLVPVPGDSISNVKITELKNRLLENSNIRNVSLSAFSPIDNSHWSSDFKFDNSPENTDFSADLKWADADFFKTYDIEFAVGRSFREADSVKGFVVNETLVKKLGYNNPRDILGKRINFWKGEIVAPIVGVVKDFHSSSLHKMINPVVIGSWKDVYSLLNIKVSMSELPSTMLSIKKIWESTYPNYLYQYKFLDDKIDNFYKSESTLSVLYSVFAFIAIFISCLGLYGLISFMTIQRTKEVGIRKVLGASIPEILFLLSKEFTKWVVIANLIAWPGAYYIMNKWLQNFAYKTDMDIWIFLISGAIALLIALLTVGSQTLKAATANPVKSLRYE